MNREKRRAIHIVCDNKFIDSAIEQFGKVGILSNRYIYFRPKKDSGFKYIEHSDLIEVYQTKEAIKHVLSTEPFDILFLHSLIPEYLYFFSYIPKHVRVVFLSWGWDLYRDTQMSFLSSYPIKISLYKDLTRKLRSTWKYKLKLLIQGAYFFRRKRILFKRAMSRIDYCSTVLPDEYDRLKELDYFKAAPFFFKYANKKKLVEDPMDLSCIYNGKNILVGNSSTPECNHLDIFELLKHLDKRGRKVIVPLNYGDKFYADKIMQPALSCLGDSYFPLLDFMPYQQYTDLLYSCSHAIMGHTRQQALGNVFIMLSQGAKVFLYEESILYKFLKGMGFHIFSIQGDLDQKEMNSVLTQEQILYNRKLIFEYISREKRMILFSESINQVIKDIRE